MLLATFKHISSKNADYSAAEVYLTFEHDEFTMKPALDENGRLIPRQNYRISTLNCGDEDFAIACLRANLRYGKKQKREDVKSHHYIISFDPKDVPDHGLTVDLAQSLGEKFCKEHFPGHQAIVCTHPDGHNGSGNVHVHIVINSLRIMEIPFMPYMDRPCDTQPGMKHRCTNAAMEYLRSEVMEMCHDAGLYQIDLLNGSKIRVTEREYWAKKKGQLALDEGNAALAEQGLPIKQTKFETDKDKLREEICIALSDAVSFEDFTEKLLRRGITVKESRGRLSYLTPTGHAPSRHGSWVMILIKRLCSPHLSEMQNRSERKHLSFILHRPCRTSSNNKTLSAVWWIWKLLRPKAEVTRIGQRNTISKMPVEPLCCIRKWDLILPKHWLPLAMLPMRS